MGHFREYTPGLGMVLYLRVNVFFLLKHFFCFSHFTYLLSRALLSVQKERSDTRNYVYVNRRAVPKIIYFLQRVTS